MSGPDAPGSRIWLSVCLLLKSAEPARPAAVLPPQFGSHIPLDPFLLPQSQLLPRIFLFVLPGRFRVLALLSASICHVPPVRVAFVRADSQVSGDIPVGLCPPELLSA